MECVTSVQAIEHQLALWSQIDLWDLPQESELLTRTDRKYVLTANQAAHLFERCDNLEVVTVNGLAQSNYESVYYDTPDLRSYTDAAHSRRRRYKVRTRTYLDTDTTLVEVKVKSGRGETIKERIPSTAAARIQLSESEQHFVASTLERNGISQPSRLVENMAPALTTTYKRATLLAPDGSRTTIDTRLACARAHENVEFPDLVLIETKSTSTATPIDKLLWNGGHRPQSVSKFAAGIALLEPALHANKWHRVLHTDAFAARTA